MAATRFLFFVMLIFAAMPSYAQQNILDDKAWQEARKNLDYSEEEPAQVKSSGSSLPQWNWDASAWEDVARYSFIIVFFGLLIFFLYRLIRGMQSRSNIKDDLYVEVKTLQEAEENPMQVNLLSLIEQLVADEKYREATRAYFLYVLQRLHKTQKISWKKQKTNFDYVRELSHWTNAQKFKNITMYFERIWYGEQDVSLSEFETTQPLFAALIAQIADEKK